MILILRIMGPAASTFARERVRRRRPVISCTVGARARARQQPRECVYLANEGEARRRRRRARRAETNHSRSGGAAAAA